MDAKIVHPRIVAAARSVMERAGGDPEASGPLAQWGADAQDLLHTDPETAIRRAVIVGRDGTLVATVQRSDSHATTAYYGTRLLVDHTPEQATRFEGRLLSVPYVRSVAGQDVIEVRFFDVCTDSRAVHGWVEDLKRMPAEELRARREYLGLTREELGVALANRRELADGTVRMAPVREDTIRGWETGRDPVPFRVPGEMRALEARTAEVVRDLRRRDPDERDWLDDEQARAIAGADWASARWWRHCMIRAQA